jgi:hypothetical protein
MLFSVMLEDELVLNKCSETWINGAQYKVKQQFYSKLASLAQL